MAAFTSLADLDAKLEQLLKMFMNFEQFSTSSGNPMTMEYLTRLLADTDACVQLIGSGPLAAWRTAQNHAIYGRPVDDKSLNDARERFLQLSDVLMRIRRLLERAPQIAADGWKLWMASFTLILQTSLVTEWSSGKTDKLQRNSEEEIFNQPPMLMRDKEKDDINLYTRVLAINGEMAAMLGKSVSVVAHFVRPPSFGDRNIAEDKAKQLRHGVTSHIAIAGRLQAAGTGVTYVSSGSFSQWSRAAVDNHDLQQNGVAFRNLHLHLVNIGKRGPCDRSVRDIRTKYHVLVQWKLLVLQNTITLTTLSTPFMVRVAKAQDPTLIGEMLWDIVASQPDSVTFDSSGLFSVPWSALATALRHIFRRLTTVRELTNSELRHLKMRIFSCVPTEERAAEFVSKAMFFEPNQLQASSSSEKRLDFSFWTWFYDAIELIVDRNATIGRPKTMKLFFREGVIQGFISRGRVERMLNRCDRSAMLLRFSDNHRAHLTISYIAFDKTQKGTVTQSLEHIRPLGRTFLQGMSLASIVALLNQLQNVQWIIKSTKTDQGSEMNEYMPKEDLTKGHLHDGSKGDYGEYKQWVMSQQSQKSAFPDPLSPSFNSPNSPSIQSDCGSPRPAQSEEAIMQTVIEYVTNAYAVNWADADKVLQYMADPNFRTMIGQYEAHIAAVSSMPTPEMASGVSTASPYGQPFSMQSTTTTNGGSPQTDFGFPDDVFSLLKDDQFFQ